MRGVVSAGMLIALADLGFAEGFDEIYGSSAGAVNAAYFLQGQRWEALSQYYYELSGKEFIDRRRPLRGGSIVDLSFLRDEIFSRSRPLRLELLSRSGVTLFVAVTNVDEHKSELISDFSSSRDLAEALTAGAWMPIMAGSPVRFRNHRCLDASVLLEHPASAAINGDCSHVLVLNTKYPSAPRRSEVERRVLRKYLNTLDAGLGEDYWQHCRSTKNHRLTLEERAERRGRAMLSVAPRPDWKTIGRLEQDMGLLLRAAQEGYEAVIQHLTGIVPRTVYALRCLEAAPAVEEREFTDFPVEE
jgi:predicted patatin/cPLA2 family phospholipase